MDLAELKNANLQHCFVQRLSLADLLEAVITIEDYPEVSYLPQIATVFDKLNPNFYANLPSCQEGSTILNIVAEF